MTLPLNYYTHLGHERERLSETDGAFYTLEWEIPLSSLALVLVDVWDWDYLEETAARDEEIIHTGILPVLEASRRAGITIIHAPSSLVADKYPQFRIPFSPKAVPTWPLRDAFGSYTRPSTANSREVYHRANHYRDLHPLVRPLPGEFVVGDDGEEIHAVLTRQKSLFLLYAGFHANLCLLVRDYGVPAMLRRRYQPIVLTDCVNAIELHTTHAARAQYHQMLAAYALMGAYTLESKILCNAF